MNTSGPKADLINRISQLKEKKIMEEIQKLLDFELNENEYVLTKPQKNRIAEAQVEYKNSACLTEDKANQDIEGWLGEK
ncbi:hypothetical protein SAMN05444360_108163 [Chryseobacterium carnipullorum]|uniref:hypothetical protein n=1 Tax=Chryseobacterium carnipullorum TaxID=1124835 RepID=UPI00092182E3|nr:hypothetical protein [Chryseobacterium carnipullorum]SHM15730.1 hypothetical protein SAMN05444360_108163 [Chryseobacterium carnipullorum]